MTVNKDGKEYSILGAKVKLSLSSDQNNKAQKAIDYVLSEANTLRKHQALLNDHDTAVLVALNLSAKYLEIEQEYKEQLLAIKEDVVKAKASLGSSTAV